MAIKISLIACFIVLLVMNSCDSQSENKEEEEEEENIFVPTREWQVVKEGKEAAIDVVHVHD